MLVAADTSVMIRVECTGLRLGILRDWLSWDMEMSEKRLEMAVMVVLVALSVAQQPLGRVDR